MAELHDQTRRGFVGRIRPGAGLRAVQAGLCVAVVLLGFGFYAFVQFWGLKDAEAMDYAQLGRNLAEGRGFTTRLLRPVTSGYLARHGRRAPAADRMPDILHGPVYPSVLALGFKILRPCFEVAPGFGIFSPERRVIVPMGILFSLGTGVLVFLLGKRLFDARVAWLAAVSYFLADAVLADSISGHPVPLVAFFATAAVYAASVAAIRREEGTDPWLPPFLLSAGLCALGFLTRYAFVALVPVIAVFLAWSWGRARLAAFLGFIAAFLLVVSPWLVRNVIVSGNPLGLAAHGVLSGSAFYPGDTFERSQKISVDNTDVGAAMRTKVESNLGRLWEEETGRLAPGLFAAFFLVSFLYRFQRDDVHRLRWCLAAGILLFLLAACLYGPSAGRLLHSFLPVVLVYGAAYFFLVLDRLGFPDPLVNRLVAAAMAVLAFLPAGLRLLGPPPEMPYPPYYPPYIAKMNRYLKDGEILVTDIPAGAAWYGGRTSLLLPLSPDEITAMRRDGLPIGGIYLTTETGNKRYVDDLLSGPDRAWLPVLNGKVPKGFPFTDGIALPPGSRDQMFLAELGRLAK